MHTVRVQQDADGRTQHSTVSVKAPQIQPPHSNLPPPPSSPAHATDFVYTCSSPMLSSNAFCLPSSPSLCPLFYKALSKRPRESLGAFFFFFPVLSVQLVLGKTCLMFPFSNGIVMSYLPLDTLSGQELCLYPGILHSYILLGSLNVCVCVCTCVLSSV